MSNINLIDQAYLGLTIPAVLLCVPPLIVQARARNFPVLVLISAVLILNLQNFANAIIWPSWYENAWQGEILCDIEVRTYAALPVAGAGAVACIFRQLAGAFQTDRIGSLPTKRQVIAKWVFELTLCVVFPVVTISTFHLAAYYRYGITRVLGCLPSVSFSWRALALQYFWQPFATIIGIVYCVLTIFRLIRHRQNVSAVLASSGMGANRHTRLLVVSICCLLLGMPGFVYVLVQILAQRWGSYQFSGSQSAGASLAIARISRKSLRLESAPRWAQMAMPIPIFVALGLGKEAYRAYKELIPAPLKNWLTHRRRLRDFGQPTKAQWRLPPATKGGMADGSTTFLNHTHCERDLGLFDQENHTGTLHELAS